MYKTGVKLLIFLVEVINSLTTIKGKTLPRGANSRMPFSVNVNLNLSVNVIQFPLYLSFSVHYFYT